LIALSYAVRHSLPPLRELGAYDQLNVSRSQDGENSLPKDAVVWMLEPRRLMEMSTQSLVDASGISNIASREDEARGMRRDFFKDPDQSPFGFSG
jgi:hypothetical protein